MNQYLSFNCFITLLLVLHCIGCVATLHCVSCCWDGVCVFAGRLEGSADVASLLSPLDCHKAQMLKITRPPDNKVKGYQSGKNMVLVISEQNLLWPFQYLCPHLKINMHYLKKHPHALLSQIANSY